MIVPVVECKGKDTTMKVVTLNKDDEKPISLYVYRRTRHVVLVFISKTNNFKTGATRAREIFTKYVNDGWKSIITYSCDNCFTTISREDYDRGVCPDCHGNTDVWIDPAGGIHNNATSYFSEE